VRIVDLSHPIKATPDSADPYMRVAIEYSGHEQGALFAEARYGVPRRLMRDGEWAAVETITFLGTHSATHVDAPWHYNSLIQGRKAQSIDELPLEWFYGPGVVVDFRHKDDGDAVTPGELEEALTAVGHDIEPGDIVLVRTGRDRFYDEPDYVARGPGVTAAATHWLHERGVRVMGIDQWGWDRPLELQAQDAIERDEPGIFWAAHQADLPYSQIERLANLGEVPPTGFTVACFPLKIVGASAAPARVVGIVPD
jgi:kynurenine formamidase